MADHAHCGIESPYPAWILVQNNRNQFALANLQSGGELLHPLLIDKKFIATGRGGIEVTSQTLSELSIQPRHVKLDRLSPAILETHICRGLNGCDSRRIRNVDGTAQRPSA
ncbi:hypothetical protein GCM10011289_34800 [Paludibacterium paludis]|uniref:Uncharacterized protein n=1 Tax=Paludibacterium paludis TaxID=1225769 RepID=A0A918UBU6_9NEIS|nr:hypothetical protein GCM10011289_34800 [Paludibacterium paludis]